MISVWLVAENREVLQTLDAVSKEGLELQLTAALGTKWAHSVNIRLVLESFSGTRLGLQQTKTVALFV